MAVKKPERKMHLTDYLWVLKKRMLLIFFFWAAVFVAVAVATFMQKATYKAQAVMLIERSIYQPQVIKDLNTGGTTAEWFKSQFRLLNSRRTAEKVYNELGMREWEFFRNLPADVDHIEVVREWIKVTPYPNTHLVEISVIRGDGREAAEIANAVTDAYRDTVKETKSSSIANSLSVLEKQADRLTSSIDAVTQQIEVLTSSGDIYAIGDIRNAVLTRQVRLQDASAQAEVELIQAKNNYKAINDAIEKGSWTPMREGDVLQSLRIKRYNIQEVIRLDQVNVTERLRQKDQYSRTLQIRLEEVDSQLALEMKRLQELAVSEAAQFSATAEANRDLLDEMLKSARDRLQRISNDMVRLEAYKKKQEDIEKMQIEFRNAAEKVKTFQDYDQTIATVVGQAVEPKQKYSPKYALNLGLGAFVGLFIGIGAAFFSEYLNTTIRMPRDIEEGLGLPVLGFVPAMSPKLKDFATRSLISHLDSTSGPAEAFRGIRTEVMLRSDLRQVTTGMVTSTSPQEGKTTVAVNWAITLAQAGNKVLLIDADLRKPKVHEAFNMNNDKGLSTLLAEKDSATVYIKKTDIENLHVLLGGPVPQNPAELLGSRKMRTLIAEAAERYDSVIIDSSPVLGVADANILSTMVDCVVLVVKASSNRRALVMRARNQLASVNARLAGAVLNNVRGSKGDYYYYRQYYRPVAQLMEEEAAR